MVNERYSIAISETLHYLKGINQEDIDKIPNKFMAFLKENASNNYTCNFDYTKPLKELNLKKETKGLIAMICLNYWCETEEQKSKFVNHLKINEQAYQEELKRKYSIDDIFKQNDINDNKNDNKENINGNKENINDNKEIINGNEENTSENSNRLPIKVKQNILKKIYNYIISLFNKK